MGRRIYWMMLGPLVALSGTSHSQEFPDKFKAYICTVRSAYKVDNGVLSPSATAGSFIGELFRVERRTGRILGSLFASDSWKGEKVLDPGSNTQSYKVIFVTPPHVSMKLLVVDEYQKGSMKDFVLVNNSDVYAGQCFHAKGKWRRIK
jgi:hypothetical protein